MLRRTRTFRADIVTSARDQLGEGPNWDSEMGWLTRVDIARGLLHGYRPRDGSTWELKVGGEIGAAIPRASGGFVLAVDHSLVLRDAQGHERVLLSVELDAPDTRFNDCRADPAGRLWAGTMSRERRPGSASLYRVDADGQLERVISGTTISNGLGWSRDGARMYFVDSTTQRIDVFDYDVASGTPSNRRAFAHISPEHGLPDGLTLDIEDCIWVCLFGGGAIRRYSPDGELELHIELPVTNPTCAAFGDDDLRTLYVTSARHRLTEKQLAAEPEAGAFLSLRPGATGRPAFKYAG
jgi:sugar lactone lactonase YvrE